MATLNIDSDELSSMSAEVARGTAKADSLYANTSEDHSYMWDILTKQVDRMKAEGVLPMQSVEIQPPLMNQDYENGDVSVAEQVEVNEVDTDDLEEGL